MDQLTELENQSVFILREAYKNFKNLAMLWSLGQDSTVMLRLAHKAFYGHIPIPVLDIEAGSKNPGMDEFKDRVVKEWNLNLLKNKNNQAFEDGTDPEMNRRICCENLKTKVDIIPLEKQEYSGFILGMRHDEERTPAIEPYFSPREKIIEWGWKYQPPEHWRQFKTTFSKGTQIRIHPLINWTKLDVREYLERELMPIDVADRYFS